MTSCQTELLSSAGDVVNLPAIRNQHCQEASMQCCLGTLSSGPPHRNRSDLAARSIKVSKLS